MPVEEKAEKFLRGCVGVRPSGRGWVWPERLTPSQQRILGSVRAWHPGLYRQMAACTAGVRLEFTTDSELVELELQAPAVPNGSQAVLDDVAAWDQAPASPWDGVACVVDGEPADLAALPAGEAQASPVFAVEAPAAPSSKANAVANLRLPGMGTPHEVELWLPALRPSAVRRLRGDGSFLEPLPKKPALLVIGDSIAQGFVSRDPSRSWPALLARELGLGLVNQGVGGQVFLPGSLADLPSRLTPARVVVELGCNYRFERCGANVVERDIRVFLAELDAAWPDVPVCVLTCAPFTERLYRNHPRSCVDEVDMLICQAAARYPHMQVVHGRSLLSKDPQKLLAQLADGSDHPNAAGHALMARRIASAWEA